MDKTEIIKSISDMLVQEFEIDEAAISPGARLKDDLGLESLDYVDIAVFIKKKFAITIKGRDVSSIQTVGNLCDYIYNHLRNAA